MFSLVFFLLLFFHFLKSKHIHFFFAINSIITETYLNIGVSIFDRFVPQAVDGLFTNVQKSAKITVARDHLSLYNLENIVEIRFLIHWFVTTFNLESHFQINRNLIHVLIFSFYWIKSVEIERRIKNHKIQTSTISN